MNLTSVADPDPSRFSLAGPDPTFHFDADPDPVPPQVNVNLRPLVYRPFTAKFWASTPPLWASTIFHGSILSFQEFWLLRDLFYDFNADLHFTLLRIWVRIRKMMRIRISNTELKTQFTEIKKRDSSTLLRQKNLWVAHQSLPTSDKVVKREIGPW